MRIAGVRQPAGHPVPGDVGEECHQRGAGLHDDGRRDQEPCRASVQCHGDGQQGVDQPGPPGGEYQVRLLLGVVTSSHCRGGVRRRGTHTHMEGLSVLVVRTVAAFCVPGVRAGVRCRNDGVIRCGGGRMRMTIL